MDIDLATIRRDAQDGIPVMPATVLKIVGRLERAETSLAEALANIERNLTRRFAADDVLLAALARYVNGDACEYGDGPPCPGDATVAECRYCQGRRAAQGRSTPDQALERAEHNVAYAMSALQRVDTERLALLDAARAYFEAVDSCNGVAAAEEQLRRAVEVASKGGTDR